MLAELPTGFAARAARRDARATGSRATSPRPLLARPEALRHVTRTLLGRPTAGGAAPRAESAARAAGRRRCCARPPRALRAATRRSATVAQRMTEHGPDVRGRRAARRRARDPHRPRPALARDRRRPAARRAGLARSMSAPAYTVPGDRLAGEVLVEMLDRGVRHFPVLSPTGALLGRRRRRRPRRGRAPHAVPPAHGDRAARPTPRSSRSSRATCGPTVVALHDARVAAEHIAAIISVVADALVRRLIDLAVADEGEPPAPFAWLALGSIARREAVPSSDVDCAIAWDGDDGDPATARYVHRVAVRVLDGPRRVRPRGRPEGRDRVAPALRPLARRLGRRRSTRGSTSRPRRRR